MNDFLGKSNNPFDRIHLKSIWTLVRLVLESTTSEMPHIQRRFLAESSNFAAVFQFLQSLGCVAVSDTSVILQPAFADRVSSEMDLSTELIRRMLNPPSVMRATLNQYFRKFQIVANRAIYRPLADHRSAESSLRNFLMELSVVRHDETMDAYVLDPEYNSLFTNAARTEISVTPRALAEQRAAAEALGTTVERAVVIFERQRLGPTYAERVQHIALVEAAAGYDVESVTIESDGVTIPRLIEVKAVPRMTFRFFWTSNEIAAARRFGPWYFLYLVPISAGGIPAIEDARLVCDPHAVILGGEHGWSVECETYRCELMATAEQGGGSRGSEE